MIEVVFKVDRKYRKWLVSKRPYGLFEAQTKLVFFEQVALNSSQLVTVGVRIIVDNASVFQENVTCGDNQSKNLLHIVQQTLETHFHDMPTEDKENFLIMLSEEIETQKKGSFGTSETEQLLVEEEKNKDNQTQVPSDSSVAPALSVDSHDETVKPLPEARPQKKKRQPSSRSSVSFMKRTWVRVGVMCLFVSVIGGGAYFLYPKMVFQSEVTEKKVLSFQTYLDKGEYESAVTYYPKKKEAISKYLSKEEEFEALKTFNQTYPTVSGTFDLAFFEKRWSDVVAIPLRTLDVDQRIMLCHAYIQLGQLEEASILNEELKSKLITEEIQTATLKKAIGFLQEGKIAEAEAIQSSLKNDSLEQLLSEARAYQKMIEKYKNEKDEENQQTWEDILKNIGKELEFE